MKTTIIRNGKEIIRNMKAINYDSNICIRMSSNTILELKKIAANKNKKYNTMIREILEEYVTNNKQ